MPENAKGVRAKVRLRCGLAGGAAAWATTPMCRNYWLFLVRAAVTSLIGAYP